MRNTKKYLKLQIHLTLGEIYKFILILIQRKKNQEIMIKKSEMENSSNRFLVDRTGLEPATSAVQVRRSTR